MILETKQWKLMSRIGAIYLVASAKGLQGIFWDPQSVPFAGSLKTPSSSEQGAGAAESAVRILAQTVQQLEEYFAGNRSRFEIPTDTNGTAFQKKVWAELSRIPYGETCSYAQVAARIGNPKAVRAVGTANGKNPLCIVVPCHRVIAANGTLGGYSGGLAIKTRLLELERGDS